MRQIVKEIIEKHQKKILPIISNHIKNRRLLDVGCGNGINSFFFSKELGTKVTLLDIEDMREKEAIQFRFFKSSADNLPFKKDSFEVIFIQYVLHHLHSKIKIPAVLSELKRVAKDKVIIVEEIFTNRTNIKKAKEYDLMMNRKLHPSNAMIIIKYYDDEELKRLFKSANLKLIQEAIIAKGCEEDGYLQRKVYILEA